MYSKNQRFMLDTAHTASSQVKVEWYRTSTQSLDKSRYLKDGLENDHDVRSLLSANQSEQSFKSEFSGHTIFTFHSNKEHVLFTQWEFVCNWFHMMPVEPIK